jgi:hypothetical protein
VVLGRSDFDTVTEQIGGVLYDESPTPKTVRLACVDPLKCPEDRRQRIGGMVAWTRSAGMAPPG